MISTSKLRHTSIDREKHIKIHSSGDENINDEPIKQTCYRKES
jgi:hypothetical protein